MSTEEYIRAMPKIELNLRLEGAVRKETWLMIAEQNEISVRSDYLDDWANLFDSADPKLLDEIVIELCQWIRQPDDLTRIVYDAGVNLARDNIRYAEVWVDPALFMLPTMSFEEFMTAISDGRDRAERGWGIQLRIILVVSRDEPRRADEVARWVLSSLGQNHAVVAIGLSERSNAQPVGQFERAFQTVLKKGLPRVAQVANSRQVEEEILEVINRLEPSRLVDGWGTADALDILKLLSDRDIPLVVSMSRALCSGWVSSYGDYPLRTLCSQGISLVISSDMPVFYNTSLVNEYLAAIEHNGFSIEEIEEFALNAVKYSFLPEKDKIEFVENFKNEYSQLRQEYLTTFSEI
jgi:adenosine deaminase